MGKRARYLSSWECSLGKKDGSRERFGLVDLLGRRSRDKPRTIGSSDREHGEYGSSSDSLASNRDNFYTFRMEHREGGTMAQQHGEERILLFRSDQPGAIAKIIYSSYPAGEYSDEENDAPQSENGMDAEDLDKMAQAKVHVLSVKDSYRGYDLGGLLFSEAMASLRRRYMNVENQETGDDERTLPTSVRCQLDAEEDTLRYNKLVGFYEQLGCTIKPKAKVTYLNNNDGETYRKVPMQIALRARQGQKTSSIKPNVCKNLSLVDRREGFLPVLLMESHGQRFGITATGQPNAKTRMDWLVVETRDGFLEFHTTKGAVLVASPDGVCKTKMEADDSDQSCDGDWSKFELLRITNANSEGLNAEENVLYAHPEIYASRERELWLIRSVHGSFLAFDPASHSLQCTTEPAFWQAGQHDFSLTCTKDSPQRQEHYRRFWKNQTVEYVKGKRERYLRFDLQRMSLKTALDLVKMLSGNPLLLEQGTSLPSMRTLCVSLKRLSHTQDYASRSSHLSFSLPKCSILRLKH